jgi:hypothetical protein
MILRSRVRWLALLSLAAATCADRTLDSDGGGATSGTDDASSAPASTDTPQPTSGPGPTAATTVDPPDPTTATTTTTGPDPSTSGPGPTSADPSLPTTATTPATDSDPTATTVPFFDFGDPPAQVPEGIWQGCTHMAPFGTAIKGETAFGQFVSSRAYFGYLEVNGQLGPVHLLFLDDTADATLAFQELDFNSGELQTGPGADVEPSLEFTVGNPFWFGKDPQAHLALVVNGKIEMIDADLEMLGHKGSWDVNDPDDPARLLGVITPAGGDHFLTGNFDAVLCNSLSTHIIAE